MDMHISDAIVMRIKEFGESDLLVTFLTPDMGRLKGVARGGRNSKKRFANCLDLFCLTRMEFQIKPKGDLHFLGSGKLIRSFQGLRSDFASVCLASYVTELTELLFPQSVVSGEIFELLKQALLALERGMDHDRVRMGFEVRALTIGGFQIGFEKCCDCSRLYTGAGRAVFRPDKGGIACLNCRKESRSTPGIGPEGIKAILKMQSMPMPWERGDQIVLNEQTAQEIRRVLNLHMEYRIGHPLKTARYLKHQTI